MTEKIDLTFDHETGPLGELERKLNEVIDELNLFKEKYYAHVHEFHFGNTETSMPRYYK